ncbi:MAG: DUF4335 domain-containing protein [Cyanobacteria bacterium J06554_6]
MAPARQLTTQRYIANACTLEVTAAPSPLSRWSRQPLLKQARFRLWLQEGETARLLAQGDQAQLSTLTNSIQDYVHQGLSQRRSSPWVIQHQLALPTQAEPLQLSTLNLFDVAEALDQYEQSTVTVPALTQPVQQPARRARRSQRLLWAGSAAAAFVVAISVTATLRNQPELASTDSAIGDPVGETEFEADIEQDMDPGIGAAADASRAAEASPAAESPQTDATADPSETASAPPAAATERIPAEAEPDPGRVRPSAPGSSAPAPAGRRSPNRSVDSQDRRESDAVATDSPSSNTPPLSPQPESSVAEPEANRPTTDTEVENSRPVLPQQHPPAADERFEPPPSPSVLERGGASRGSEDTFSTSRSPAPAATVPPATVPPAAETQAAPPFSASDHPYPSIVEYFRTQLAGVAISTPLRYRVTVENDGQISEIAPLNPAALEHPIPLPANALTEVEDRITLQVTIEGSGNIELRVVE